MSVITQKEWFTLKEASEITGRSLNSIRLLVHRKKITNTKKITENGREQWMVHRDTLSALSAAEVKDDLKRCESCTMKDGVDPTVCEEICGKTAPEIQDICHENIIPETEKPKVQKQQTQPEDTAHKTSPAFLMQGQTNPTTGIYVASIPLDHYEQKQKEWSLERDRLIQGILLYRYRNEELSNKMKALPAPPEYMKTRVLELEKQVAAETSAKEDALKNIEKTLNEVVNENQKIRSLYESKIDEANEKLKQEEEEKATLTKQMEEREEELLAQISTMNEALTDAKRPWWKKWFGVQ